jgi:hypothetical protein
MNQVELNNLASKMVNEVQPIRLAIKPFNDLVVAVENVSQQLKQVAQVSAQIVQQNAELTRIQTEVGQHRTKRAELLNDLSEIIKRIETGKCYLDARKHDDTDQMIKYLGSGMTAEQMSTVNIDAAARLKQQAK